ncbi:MAG: AraC family transcriptional regulator [Planctomycetota bacterium]
MRTTVDDLNWLEASRLVVHHAGTVHYPPGAIIGPRRIPDLELVWISSGTTVFEGGDGLRCELHPGDVIVVRPGERHRFVMDRRRMLAHGFAHFSLPAADMRRIAAWPRPVHAADGSPLRHAVESCERLIVGHRPDSAVPRLALRLALALYHAAGQPETAVPWSGWKLDPRVAAVLAAVRSTWQDRPAWAPTRDELCALAGCSEAALGRAFRTALGVAPTAAIRLWRVERAAVLMARGGQSVSAAARAIGWRSPDVFTRAFRAAYGLAPREAARRAAAGAWTVTPRLFQASYGKGMRPSGDPTLSATDPTLSASASRRRLPKRR